MLIIFFEVEWGYYLEQTCLIVKRSFNNENFKCHILWISEVFEDQLSIVYLNCQTLFTLSYLLFE